MRSCQSYWRLILPSGPKQFLTRRSIARENGHSGQRDFRQILSPFGKAAFEALDPQADCRLTTQKRTFLMLIGCAGERVFQNRHFHRIDGRRACAKRWLGRAEYPCSEKCYILVSKR